MSRLLICLVVALLSPATSFAATGDEAALRAASDREVVAFLAADTQGLANLWSDSFVVTNPYNRFANKSQVLGMTASGALRFSGLERTVDYARIYGDIGILAGAETARWAGTLPLAGKTSHLRYTAVWRQEGGAWREIARHANIVPDP